MADNLVELISLDERWRLLPSMNEVDREEEGSEIRVVRKLATIRVEKNVGTFGINLNMSTATNPRLIVMYKPQASQKD